MQRVRVQSLGETSSLNAEGEVQSLGETSSLNAEGEGSVPGGDFISQCRG